MLLTVEVVSCVTTRRVVMSWTETEAAEGASEEGAALGPGEELATGGTAVTSISDGSLASSSDSSVSLMPFAVWRIT